MIPANLFQAELLAALTPGRKALLRIGLTLLLGLPFVLIDLPLKARTSGLSMLILFHSFFGAAVGYVRAKDQGRLTWQSLWPQPAWQRTLDRVLAAALVDLIQCLVLMILFVLVSGQGGLAAAFLRIAVWLWASLVALNFLGLGLGSLAGSNAEVHLFGALGVGLIALLCGLLPFPGGLPVWLQGLAELTPLNQLARALADAAAGASFANPATLPAAKIMGLFSAWALWRFWSKS